MAAVAAAAAGASRGTPTPGARFIERVGGVAASFIFFVWLALASRSVRCAYS